MKHNILLLSFLSMTLIDSPSHGAKNDDSLIEWSDWSDEAFKRAAKNDQMILVNVGIEVCFACRWMEEGTYQVPEVAKLVNDNFVTIQVDANARPDLGERYSDWAWPATIFMAPDGEQVLGVRGNRRPRNFIPILNKLIEQHANDALEPDSLAPYAAPQKPAETALTKIRDGIRSHLDRDFDDAIGGWGDELKEIDDVGRIEQLIYRAYIESDTKSRERALKTAYAMVKRSDPVWGGFYAAGYQGWNEPVPEKRTGAQASALLTYAWAYQMTGDAVFTKAAAEVDRYLHHWMLTKDGTFYTSQEDQPENLPNGMKPLEYFALDDKARRQLGIPPIDHAVYTDLNARLIVAYARLYEATNNEGYLITAKRAAQQILDTGQHADGWVRLTFANDALQNDDRIHKLVSNGGPFLRAQSHMGNALLALARASGDKKWINSAVRLAEGMRAKLEDPKLGGFFASPVTSSNAAIAPRKPLEDNGVAARFFHQLSTYTKNKQYDEVAERAIRAVAVPEILAREGRIVGNMAVALESVTGSYVEFSVVGTDPTDPKAAELYSASRAVTEPRKILHYEAPGRYPDSGKPSLYICSPQACSRPIFNPELVATEAKKFRNFVANVSVASNK